MQNICQNIKISSSSFNNNSDNFSSSYCAAVAAYGNSFNDCNSKYTNCPAAT
jgi:hypothetical protein